MTVLFYKLLECRVKTIVLERRRPCFLYCQDPICDINLVVPCSKRVRHLLYYDAILHSLLPCVHVLWSLVVLLLCIYVSVVLFFWQQRVEHMLQDTGVFIVLYCVAKSTPVGSEFPLSRQSYP